MASSTLSEPDRPSSLHEESTIYALALERCFDVRFRLQYAKNPRLGEPDQLRDALALTLTVGDPMTNEAGRNNEALVNEFIIDLCAAIARLARGLPSSDDGVRIDVAARMHAIRNSLANDVQRVTGTSGEPIQVLVREKYRDKYVAIDPMLWFFQERYREAPLLGIMEGGNVNDNTTDMLLFDASGKMLKRTKTGASDSEYRPHRRQLVAWSSSLQQYEIGCTRRSGTARDVYVRWTLTGTRVNFERFFDYNAVYSANANLVDGFKNAKCCDHFIAVQNTAPGGTPVTMTVCEFRDYHVNVTSFVVPDVNRDAFSIDSDGVCWLAVKEETEWSIRAYTRTGNIIGSMRLKIKRKKENIVIESALNDGVWVARFSRKDDDYVLRELLRLRTANGGLVSSSSATS